MGEQNPYNHFRIDSKPGAATLRRAFSAARTLSRNPLPELVMTIRIEKFEPSHLPDVLTLSFRAWTPVFAELQSSSETFVLQAFYPNGWWARQRSDIEAMVDDDKIQLWVSKDAAEAITGFVGVRLHPDDQMGEIHILGVDPDQQRRGVGSALMSFAFAQIKDAGMQMVMVETGGDPGHAPSRAAYERMGFKRWPVARYFREL